MEFRGKGVLKSVEKEVISGLLPPYPGIGMIKPVIIPPPPKIQLDFSDEEIAVFIGGAYRGAVKEVFKRNCYSFVRGDITKSKPYKIMVVAGKILREYGVAPISWAIWSSMVWQKWKGDKGNPPVNWVYAFNRIDQYMSLFRKEFHVPTTPTVFLTPTHRRFLQTYDAMVFELGNAERAEYGGILEQYFPGELYGQLVKKCKTEVQSLQTGLQRRIQRGEWIWKI